MSLTCLKVHLRKCRRKIYFLAYFFLLFNIYIVNSLSDFVKQKDDVERIWTVAGKRADLPCQRNPRKSGDTPILILWYRDSINKPVYSYDARHGDFSSGERWSNKSLFDERAYFVPMADPPKLILEPVMPQDEGLYTCRLDYLDSPTTSSSTHLKVLIFPIPPEIIWNGHKVIGPIGPLKENSVHEITCLTRGGRPSPSLVWWLEGHKAMNQRQEVDENGEVRSVLALKASRDLNMKTLSCHAQIRNGAAPVTQPLTASIRLNVTLPPLGISIEGGEHPVPVDTTLTLLCLSWGSFPPAEITWWKSGDKIKNYSYSIKDRGNITSSAIKVLVEKSDNGAEFTCRASNHLTQSLPLVVGRSLNVTYRPSVELHVKVSEEQISDSGEVLQAKRRNVVVKQGSHVRLECSSNANPFPDYIEWLQNGVVIDSGREAWSYLLDGVTKDSSGIYACAATNSVGRGISSAYNIVVEHPPECSTGWQKRTQGTEVGRSSTILCRVESLPSTDLIFSWSKLNENNMEDRITDKKVQTDGTTSRLTITPKYIKDFGIFLCRAKNSVGLQIDPCEITLVPASPPDPPLNCSVDNENSPGGLSVSCVEGFDGGFPQKFILVAIQNGKVEANITRDFPEWMIKNLEQGKRVTLRMYAFNARGRSESVRLEVYVPMPQIMSDQDFNSQENGNISQNNRATLPLIGIFVGTGGVLIIASVIFLCFFCASRGRLLDWGKKSHHSSMNHDRNSHTMFYSPSIFDQSQDSEISVHKERLIPDPDIVSCIQYESRASSHKGLDVLPPGNLCQPLIGNSERTLSSSAHDDCSLGGNSSQSLTSRGKRFDDEESIIAVVESSTFKPNGYSSIDELRQIKGVPHLNHMSEEQQQIPHTQVQEENYISNSPMVSRDRIDPNFSTPNTYDCNSTYALFLGNSNSICRQCLENISNYQLHNADLKNPNSNDSLVYSNSCCAEHNDQYYLYRHFKQKNYVQFDGRNHSHSKNNHSNASCEPSCSAHSSGKSRRRSSEKMSPKTCENILQNSRLAEYSLCDSSSREGSLNSLKKNKNWNYRCGELLCSGNHYLSDQTRDGEYRKSVELVPMNAYKSFEKLSPKNPSAKKLTASNDENLYSTKATDCKGSQRKTTPNIITSMSEENLRTFKQKENDRVFSSSNLYSHVNEPVERLGLDTMKSSTKSQIRLRDIGKSDIYERREQNRTNTNKKEKPPIPKHSKSNEAKSQRTKTKEKKPDARKGSPSEKFLKDEEEKIQNLKQSRSSVSTNSPKTTNTQLNKTKGSTKQDSCNFNSSISEYEVKNPLLPENSSYETNNTSTTSETPHKESGGRTLKKNHSSKSKSNSTNAVNDSGMSILSLNGVNNNQENKINKSDDKGSKETLQKSKNIEGLDSNKHNTSKSDINSNNSLKMSSDTELKSVDLIRKIENSKKLKSQKLVTVSNPEVRSQILKGENSQEKNISNQQILPLKSILRNSK